MNKISFQILQRHDTESVKLIAGWYFDEWKIPAHKTISRLEEIVASPQQFQMLIAADGHPVATGGIYDHVGLLDKEPRFKIFKHWLALVYTVPSERGKGYGAMLCRELESEARKKGIRQIHLFTDTAEQLYVRLGWTVIERCQFGERTIAVMEKNLK